MSHQDRPLAHMSREGASDERRLRCPTTAASATLNSARPASSPAPTGPRPMAKSNASTAPSSKSGPTYGPTPQTTSEQQPSTPSFTPTTTIAATPHSEASPRSAASTTLRVNTTRAPPTTTEVTAIHMPFVRLLTVFLLQARAIRQRNGCSCRWCSSWGAVGRSVRVRSALRCVTERERSRSRSKAIRFHTT